MLRTLRKVLAVLFFAGITLLFLDFTGVARLWLGWLAKVQLVKAVLAVNAAVIASLVLLTLLFGRVYCSVICPLGVLQDGISHVSSRRKGKKNRFRYAKAQSWLRYGVLVLFIAALVGGVGVVVSLLDPYAGYGRVAANFFAPVYRMGNNLLAWFAERAGSYAFYPTQVWIKNWTVFGVAALTLGVVGVLAWRRGRTWCNALCPVGTVLGLLSRVSIFRPAFDREKCTKCGLCERSCKGSCIDSANMKIDQSRCVACFDCIDKCKFEAMNYTARRTGKAGQRVEAGGAGKGFSRRNFLSIAGLALLTHTVKAQQLKVDGGLAEIEDKQRPERKTPVVPPGAGGAAHIKQHCTACQLCVSSCPNHILVPSGSLSTLMQPEMTFEQGFCRPECVECSQVCPTGAIAPIDAAEKSAISIGQAVWIGNNCIVNTDQLPCTACQRHCPTAAIALVALNPEDRKSLQVPVINKELCIGCGACEYYCPARPFSAIYVEGNHRHHSV